jgi:hypothetical protein
MAGYIGNTAAFLSSTSGADIDGTVTADGLTVDTTTLVVDSTNNRVGIGTSSPTSTASAGPTLEISGTAGGNLVLSDSNATTGQRAKYFLSQGGALYIGHSADNGTSPVNDLAIDGSGNVGIGTISPSTYGGKLNITDGAAGGETTLVVANNNANQFIRVGINANVAQIAYDDADSLAFGIATDSTTSGLTTEHMRITSGGNVGIGTSSPLQDLHISSTSGTKAIFERTGSTGAFIGLKDSSGSFVYLGDNNGTFEVQTAGSSYSTKLAVTSAGNVGIGTSSPNGKFETYSNAGVGGGNYSALVVDQTSEGGAASLSLTSLFTNTNNTNKEVAAIKLGTVTDGGATPSADIRFETISSNTLSERMRIDSNGNVGIGTSSPQKTLDVRGELAISNSTTSYWNLNRDDTDGSLTFTDTNVSERMRIDSSGRVMIATSTPETRGITLYGNGVNGMYVKTTSTTNYWITRDGQGAGSGNIATIYSDTSLVGSISVSATTTSYNTSSDHRLKENVTDVTDGITRVKQLEPKRFNFIADPDKTVDGFLAHEAQSVVPEAVTGTHNEVDDDGNAVMQGIDQSKLVPLLTAALKEAITKIETLETEMTSVKARLDALEGS